MICVLVVASGAHWESRAIEVLTEDPATMVLKRCVDVDDLLAAAGTGQAEVAVLGLDAPGLDTAAVEHLRRSGVRAVAVVAGSGPVGEAGRLHASRLGIDSLLGEGDLDHLAEAVAADPEPTVRRGVPDDAAPAPDPAPAAPARGRVIAVWGPGGAPGRTTVACGLAATLAARRQPVVLVDADPWGGTAAQHLGVLDEVSGLLAAARLATSGQLADRLPSVQRRLSPYLSIVTGLPRADRYVEVRSGAVELLVESLRPFAHVVVDTGFSLEDDPGADFGSRPARNSMTLGALDAADEVVVVGAADPVGLSRLARGLVDLREGTGGQPVRVVINRQRASLAWSERDITGMVEGFARVLGHHFLPDDSAATDRALVAGRALPDLGDGPLVRALAGLADAVLPDTAPPAGRRRLGRRGRRSRVGAQAANSR